VNELTKKYKLDGHDLHSVQLKSSSGDIIQLDVVEGDCHLAPEDMMVLFFCRSIVLTAFVNHQDDESRARLAQIVRIMDETSMGRDSLRRLAKVSDVDKEYKGVWSFQWLAF
jgi:hypothetical protein